MDKNITINGLTDGTRSFIFNEPQTINIKIDFHTGPCNADYDEYREINWKDIHIRKRTYRINKKMEYMFSLFIDELLKQESIGYLEDYTTIRDKYIHDRLDEYNSYVKYLNLSEEEKKKTSDPLLQEIHKDYQNVRKIEKSILNYKNKIAKLEKEKKEIDSKIARYSFKIDPEECDFGKLFK